MTTKEKKKEHQQIKEINKKWFASFVMCRIVGGIRDALHIDAYLYS